MGQARKMVQNPPKISPVNQLYGHFAANSWSKPKTKMQNGCFTVSKKLGSGLRAILRTRSWGFDVGSATFRWDISPTYVPGTMLVGTATRTPNVRWIESELSCGPSKCPPRKRNLTLTPATPPTWEHIGKTTCLDPAALKAKIKIESILSPGSGPKPAPNHRSSQENGSPDPPPDPPGGGRPR